MSIGSPSAYLLWSILSCIFLALLVIHLWLYDRFACLKWDSGRQPGAFKRVMTYSYLGTLPTLICFSIAMTSLKFEEGWVMLPTGKIIPRPFDYWQPSNKRWLLPLFFTLSVSWSLELVTHLEELTFWLFLLHQGPGKRDWFKCWEFRTWYIGSSAALLGMPLTTLVSRHNLETCLGWIFFVGSLAGTVTTVCFLYVIYRFPKFLEYVKAEGADPGVVVRLATFYQLNCIRIVFRFLFSLPLLILSLDAILGHFPVIRNPFAVDFLLITAGVGSFISSGITLLVFFPRSITQESGYQVKIISPHNSTVPHLINGPEYYHNHQDHFRGPSNPLSALDGPAASRMHSFQFPRGPLPMRNPNHAPPALHHQISTESANLSFYGSDRESLAMTPKSMPNPVRQSQSQPGHQRPESLRNSASGTRPDDAVWEVGEVVIPVGRDTFFSTFRRHSDGPFVYKRHGKLARASPERSVQSRFHHESQLHHYASCCD